MKKIAFLGLAFVLLTICTTGCHKEDIEDEKKIVDGVTQCGMIGRYAYVDLGLSVKWATYNVGAPKPTGYGKHFAWGETVEKEKYLTSNYKWYDQALYDHLILKRELTEDDIRRLAYRNGDDYEELKKLEVQGGYGEGKMWPSIKSQVLELAAYNVQYTFWDD